MIPQDGWQAVRDAFSDMIIENIGAAAVALTILRSAFYGVS